jgi:hypothetical protein
LKAILRTAVVVAGLATAVATSITPASAAPGAVAFVGSANITCFGCGDSAGTASLTGVGVVNGGAANGSASATYTVHEDTGAGCIVSGTASGSVSGAVNVDFNWTRVGAVAVISTTGDVNGQGVAAFVVTSPVGNPCGGAVSAEVAGAVAGA